MKKTIAMLLLLLCAVAVVNAQQGFGTNTPDASAVMDMTATNKGVLIPRVALTATTDAVTIPSPATNLLVFNTATAGTSPNNVTPGFYYWNSTAWVRLLNMGDNTGLAWNLTGNAGTTPGTNFVGTTDVQDFAFKTNNTEQMRITSAGRVGIGTTAPATSALLDVASTTRGFLLPRMTATQMAAIPNPAEGLIVYNTTQQCLAYYANGAFTCSFSSPPPFVCDPTMTVAHTVGTVAPVTKTVTYGLVATAIGGTGTKCWITQNLGADNQASSATDATEAAAGWYWQFNRLQGYKHDGTTRTPGTVWDTTQDNMSATWEAAKDPCTQLLGPGWRIPTYTEWFNADAAPQNWNNYTDGYNSVLKLHAAGGLKIADGSLIARAIGAYYWSSTQVSATLGNRMVLNSSSANINSGDKATGDSMRCLRD